LILPGSRFNPYVIGAIGKTSWDLGSDGRGSTPVAIDDEPLEGDDWAFGGGLGTEYGINGHLGIEAEWLWSYFLTEDTQKWEDNVSQWTNTHAYRLSLGIIYWF
jgi:opacity protein-like surface antigen